MNIEDREQMSVMDWAQMNYGRYPELRLLYHVPNEGQRTPQQGAKLRRMGLKAGVPDLCLPVARGGFHGLYIELKSAKGRPTENQNRWIAELKKQGYSAWICYGWEAAVQCLKNYLESR